MEAVVVQEEEALEELRRLRLAGFPNTELVMIWQDAIFSIGTMAFAAALIPAIRAKLYPPPSTCFVTGVFLLLFAITNATLGLWFAAAFSVVSALLWLCMGFLAR